SKQLRIRRERCAQHFHRRFRSSCRCNSCRSNSQKGSHIGNHSRMTHSHSYHTHIRSRGRRGIRILRISVGFVWVVAPVPAPPRTPPPWRSEVADKNDFVEMLEATKLIISIKVSI